MKRWGVIGASTIAREWMIGAINAQPDSRVTALLSTSKRRCALFAGELSIPATFTDLEAFLAHPRLDAVYISTTNELHMPQTLAAAKAGKHVLCEKPLALTLADAHTMVKSCRKAGVVMGTNHHLRNAVTHRTMCRLVQSGAIGTPLAIRVFHAVSLPQHLRTWRINKPKAGAGVVLDITVHDTDTLRFILKSEVVEVSAMTTSQGLASGAIPDGVMGIMRFENGVLAQFHDAFTIGHAGTGLQIHGTTGSLLAEDVMTQQPVGRIFRRVNDHTEVVPLPPSENLYERAVRRFNRAIDGHGSPSATADDGVRSLAVALAVEESAQTGRRIQVQYA